MPDLMTILANLSSQIAPIIMMLQVIAALMGIYFIGAALIEFWGIDNANANKYVAGNARFSFAGAIIKLFLGGIMTAMGTLEMVGILSRTLTDTYANSRFLSYAPSGGTFDEQRLAAMGAILGIMQIVGFVAMLKGWLTINKVTQGQAQGGYGTAVGWLIGGVIAWNFKWFTDVANCTFGFNVIGIFTPFGMQNACH